MADFSAFDDMTEAIVPPNEDTTDYHDDDVRIQREREFLGNAPALAEAEPPSERLPEPSDTDLRVFAIQSAIAAGNVSGIEDMLSKAEAIYVWLTKTGLDTTSGV